MEIINLLMSSNDLFFKGVLCTLLSLKKRTNKFINLFFAGSISLKNKNILCNYADNVVFIDDLINPVLNKLSYVNKPDWISIESLTRVFAPYYIDEDYLLWLDADTIVVSDISDLFDVGYSDVALGVFDKQEQKKIINEIIDEPFNAGVLYFNVKEYRSVISINNLISFITENNDYLKWFDQDILNVIFNNHKKYISNEYNWRVVNRFLDKPNNTKGAKILHYWGLIKPWNYKYFSFFSKRYFWKYGIKVFGFNYYFRVNLINAFLYPFYLFRRIVFKIGAP